MTVTRLPLFVRLALALAGVVGLATVVAAGLTDWSLRADLERAARGRLKRAARAAGQLVDIHLGASWQRYKAISGTPQFRASLEVNDPPTLAHYAAEVRRSQGATRVLFLNVDGEVVAAAGDSAREPATMVPNGPSLVVRDGQPSVAIGLPLETAGQDVGRLVAIEPIDGATVRRWSRLCGATIRFRATPETARTLVARIPGTAAPHMTVTISLAAERHALANTRRQLLLAGATAFLAALFVSLALSRKLVTVIQTIKGAADQVAIGDFAVHIASARRDELGDVARAVDDMASRLSVARETLQANEERFRLLSACAPVGILQMDPAGQCVYSNARWQEISGLTAAASAAEGWVRAILPDDRDGWLTAWRAAMRDRGAVHRELQIRSSQGETRWVQAHAATMLSGENGALRGYIVTVEDITPLKEAEADLAAARDQALEAMRVKSEFLANVSHELRTPMNGIFGMTEMLLGTDLSADQRESIEVLRRCAEELLSTIDDVLDFSKLETKRLELETKPFHPREAVNDVVRLLAPSASEKALVLAVDIQPEMPETVLGDAHRWQQILGNLIGNAIKFTHAGEVRARVGVAHTSGNAVVVRCSVGDTGIGIAPEKQRVIFDAFVQGDGSMTRQYGGTGLGLAISAQLVRMMNGRIWLESEIGKGSTFHVDVPFAVERDVNRPAPRLPTPERRARLRILLAEDDPTNRMVAVRLLEKRGHTLVTAENGRQALRLLEQERFDIVIMDVQMPEMDGLAATEAIRARERTTGAHVPIVALTAHAMPRDRERCLQAGMDLYMTKPIKPDELFASVEGLLDVVRTSQDDGRLLLEELRDGVLRRDPRLVEGAARRLRKLVAPAATVAHETVLRLEGLRSAGDLELAEDLVRTLERELEQLAAKTGRADA
jgi:PAS domain S-box-containing protein